MKRIITFVLLCALTILHVNARADVYDNYESDLEFYLPYVIQLKASRVDPALPSISLGEWLSQVLGRDTQIRWDINDCGEQTGNPEIDADVDIPTCAEVDASLKDGREVFLWLLVGTDMKGVVDDPGLFFGVIKSSGRELMINKLSDLPGRLKESAGDR